MCLYTDALEITEYNGRSSRHREGAAVVKLETFMHFELIDRSPHTESNVSDQNKRSLINWNIQIDQ